MKNPKKITFEGFYGFKNAGDDAFVEVASWGSRKYWNCENNVFLGAHLPEVKNKINQSQLFPSVKGFDRVNLFRHLLNSDYFISAGGSTFSELPIHSNKNLAYNFNKIDKNIQLGAIGVSIGPFKSIAYEKKIIKYLESLHFLAVRDSSSFNFVSSLNLPYNPVNAFDLAALLPFIYNVNTSHSATNIKTIGVSICNYESYKNGDIEKEKHRNLFFKQLAEMLVKREDIALKVFIINGNKKTGDEEATLELLKDIPKAKYTILPYTSNVENTWNEISSCDLVISTRLHASIFACYAAVPFMLFEYHKKCSDFLTDVGQKTKFRLYDAEIGLQEAYTAVEEILDNRYIEPTNIKATIERSKLNFTETLPLIGG